METYGALMISGAWGSGKTYYIDHTLKNAFENDGKFIIKISLFGLNRLDNLENTLQNYS